VLASRTEALWMLAICFTAGFAWWSLWRFVARIKGTRLVERLASGTAIAAFAVSVHLSPIVTYKMDWDSIYREYLKISSMYPPKMWTIFSQEEEYSLLYGSGWHQYIRTLVTQYDPKGQPITRVGQDEYDIDTTKYMYVIEEKQVFKVPKTLGIYDKLTNERYNKHEEDQKLLTEWLNEYKQAHGKLPEIFYEDEHIRIWYLERPDAKDKEERRIWGTPTD
jgi:hypothetical protein